MMVMRLPVEIILGRRSPVESGRIWCNDTLSGGFPAEKGVRAWHNMSPKQTTCATNPLNLTYDPVKATEEEVWLS